MQPAFAYCRLTCVSAYHTKQLSSTLQGGNQNKYEIYLTPANHKGPDCDGVFLLFFFSPCVYISKIILTLFEF